MDTGDLLVIYYEIVSFKIIVHILVEQINN